MDNESIRKDGLVHDEAGTPNVRDNNSASSNGEKQRSCERRKTDMVLSPKRSPRLLAHAESQETDSGQCSANTGDPEKVPEEAPPPSVGMVFTSFMEVEKFCEGDLVVEATPLIMSILLKHDFNLVELVAFSALPYYVICSRTLELD